MVQPPLGSGCSEHRLESWSRLPVGRTDLHQGGPAPLEGPLTAAKQPGPDPVVQQALHDEDDPVAGVLDGAEEGRRADGGVPFI